MTETGSTTKKRGHNAIVTGLAMLVFGIVAALAGRFGDTPFGSFGALIAFAGIITLMVGFGLRREKP